MITMSQSSEKVNLERKVRAHTVSVVVPAFNAARFIAHSLQSVLSQTHKPFEVIVVDDGSQDETPQVVRAFGEKVNCIRKERGGAASARNLGIQSAQGEWVAFLDADDVWVPNRLEQQLALAQATGADFVFSDARILGSETTPATTRFSQYGAKTRLLTEAPRGVLPNPFEMLLDIGCFVLTSTVLVRRTSLLDAGLFDENLYCGEDMDLWLRLSLNHRFAVVPEPLVTRCVHGKNLSGDPWTVASYELEVCENLEKRCPAIPASRWRNLLRKKKAGLYREQASLYLQRGDITSARACWARSWRVKPSGRVAVYWAMSYLPPAWVNALRQQRLRFLNRSNGEQVVSNV